MRAWTAAWRPALALVLAAGLPACATGRLEGGVFHSAKGYRVTLPRAGWEVVPDGAGDLELRRSAPPGGILADATCGGAEPRRALPLLARHLTFGLDRRETVERETRTIGGRPAARAVVRGERDGVEVMVEAVVIRGERCVYDFLYVAPARDFEVGRGDFRALVESWVGEP